MSKILCMDCFEVYDNDKIVYDKCLKYNFCPKANCNGVISEIDDIILPTIIELNKKGWITEYCCGGHYGEASSIYIKFAYNFMRYITKPKGFTAESGNIIRFNLDEELSENDKWYKILKYNEILNKWANELPYCKEEYYI